MGVAIQNGLCILIVGYLFNTGLTLLYFAYFPTSDISAALSSPAYYLFKTCVTLVTNLIIVSAGFTVGRTLQKQGIIYGVTLGLLATITSIIIFICSILIFKSFIFPGIIIETSGHYIFRGILGLLKTGAWITFFTALGGWLGEWSLIKNSKKGNHGK